MGKQLEIEIEKTTRGGDLFKIDVRNIKVGKYINPRTVFDTPEDDELEASIAENGVQTPLLVKKIKGTDYYDLVDGERRWRACMRCVEKGKEAGQIVTATIFQGSEEEALVYQLNRNKGVQLNMVDEAAAFSRFVGWNWSNKKIALKTGHKESYISNLLKLNEAPFEIKEMIKKDLIKPSLVMQLFREYKDFDDVLVVIKLTAEAIETAVGKPAKITKSNIDASEKKTNSFSALKKAFTTAEKKGYNVREDKQEIFKVLQRLYSGKYTMIQILKELYEDIE